MSTSWFVWLWAAFALIVVAVLVVVVVTGFTVLRLVRGQWTRLVSKSKSNQAETSPAPRRSGSRRRSGYRPGVHSPRSADAGHEHA